MVLSSTDLSNEKSITDMILAELAKARLTSSKILSQVYDGTSVMAGHCGGAQHVIAGTRKQKSFLCALTELSIARCSGARNVG